MSAREKLLKQFRDLVGERLGRITKHLMELEGASNPEAGRQTLRELHGLKGEARMMGFGPVNTLVHEMEELVRATEPRGYALSGGSTDALLVASDAVKVLSGAQEASGAAPDVEKLVGWLKQCLEAERLQVTAATAGPEQESPVHDRTAAPPAPPAVRLAPAAPPVASTPAPTSGPTAPPVASPNAAAAPAPTRMADKVDHTVRIDLGMLESLTFAVTNLSQLVRRRELAAVRRLELGRELGQLARLAEDLGPAGANLAGRLGKAKELVAELHREAKLLANEELRDLSQLNEDVQSLRMLPLATLFEPYPRMVRDLARELGKEVELAIEGEENRADRAVVEALRDPLLHLVRNALDHGLETREERVLRGKSPKGRLELRAAREGEHILIRVHEDGRGLDAGELRRVAVRKGFLDEVQAQALSDVSVGELIFLPGFSSKDTTTDLSGRGVGLDAVRARLQSLGGEVQVTSELGRGATFELRVPVSLTVAPLLFVQVGEERLCLTAAHVQRAMRILPEHLRELAGRPALSVDGQLLPFASIASTVGMGPERPAQEGELALVLAGQGRLAAISVDRVLEERVQPILPLRGMLSRFPHLSGATTLADGRLAMVLSAAQLVQVAHGGSAPRSASVAPRPEVKRRRILVVDDSPLTRELLTSLLEAVGYEVGNAQDGLEGLELLGREPFDLLVTDLEMPRMDGLELTKRVKSHPTLRVLPVIIVTTRGGEVDRRRGMEAGADGYISKGDLVRQDLVDVVARLLG